MSIGTHPWDRSDSCAGDTIQHHARVQDRTRRDGNRSSTVGLAIANNAMIELADDPSASLELKLGARRTSRGAIPTDCPYSIWLKVSPVRHLIRRYCPLSGTLRPTRLLLVTARF